MVNRLLKEKSVFFLLLLALFSPKEIFALDELHKGIEVDKVIMKRGSLPKGMFLQILNCYQQLKEDIAEKHFKMIGR